MSDAILQYIEDAVRYTGQSFLGFLSALLGVLILVVILLIMHWLGSQFRVWFLGRMTPRWQGQRDTAALLDNLLRVGFILAGLVLGMGVVGVSPDSMVTWIGFIVAALSIALQDVIKNLVAGFYLLIEQPFRTGDRLAIQDQEGSVEGVDLRVTRIRNRNRQLVMVPNYLVFSQVVTNKTALEPNCLVLTISSLRVDPARIDAVIREAVASVPGSEHSSIASRLNEISASGLTTTVRIWMPNDDSARDRMIVALHNAHPEVGITVVDG